MSQFRDWQFTKGAVDPPEEYAEYLLCKAVYHCTPDELSEQDEWTTNLHFAFYVEELKAQDKQRGTTRRIGRTKREQ